MPHLDVHQDFGETVTALAPGIVYSRLLRLRTGPPDEIRQPSLLLECELCEGWQMEDPFTYRFQLRKGVRWQDIAPVRGRELTAADVVFSYQRQRTPGFSNGGLLQNLESITAEDSHTLLIKVNPGFPDADFLVSLADGHSKVVAEEAVKESKGDLRGGPVVGSGPWIWKSTSRDLGVGVHQEPRLLRGWAALPGRAGRKRYQERPQPVRRLRHRPGGRLPDNGGVLGRANRQRQALRPVSGPPGRHRPLAGHERVQAALRQRRGAQGRSQGHRSLELYRYSVGRQGYVGVGMPVLRPDWLLTRDQMREAYFADPSGSRDILSATGPSGPITIDLIVADFGDLFLDQGARLREDLRSVGFDPTVRVLNPSQYDDIVWRDKDYQISIGVPPPLFTTTNRFLLGVLHSQVAGGNLSAHADAQLDEMIARQAVELDPIRRGERVREIQRYLMEQAYLVSPATGNLGTGTTWVFNTSLKGFHPNTAGVGVLLLGEGLAGVGALTAGPGAVLVDPFLQRRPSQQRALDAHWEPAHPPEGL